MLFVQGAIVFSSLYGCHKDESIWSMPEEFQPHRFLDQNGKFSAKLDKSLPFGAGRRVCAGETFSRNLIFLVISAIIQNFNIPQNEKIPAPRETHTGVIRSAPDFWMILSNRFSS